MAKASMDELGMGGTNRNAFTGPVHNPYDLDRISGGSSGGSAVLVASKAVPLAIEQIRVTPFENLQLLWSCWFQANLRKNSTVWNHSLCFFP